MQQHDDLNKKLSQAINARMDVEQARKQQIDLLSHFSAKLSLCAKGIDKELDNRLAKFRTALTKGVDFEVFEPLIDEVLILLKNQEVLKSEQQRALFDSVQHAGKQLQKSKGLPDDTRRTLRNLLDHDLTDIQSVNDFIPTFDSLVKIFNQALSARQSQPTLGKSPHPKLANELLGLINALVFEDLAGVQLETIKKTISEDSSLDVLLTKALDVIRIVSQSMSKERQSAQNFLVSLNQTLGELHVSILETSQYSEEMGVEFSELNKRIEDKIKSLTNQTKAATSMSSLKALVNNELKLLNQDLAEKEQLEQKDRETLISRFDDINDQIVHLETKLTKYKDRLHEQRFINQIDGLTKLPNRSAFDERFNHEFNLFNLHQCDVTLVIIDVDHFKSINDKFGHSAGDKTLQVIAKILQRSIRQSDFIARFGGEEFVLLMPGMKLENATAPLEKLRKAIKSIPFKFKDIQVQITVSIGATQFKPSDTQLVAFDRADDQLYKAKHAGRDQVCLN